MQYVDPYLFYAYELRKYSLDTRIILVIGYSFGDEHINSILRQALEHDNNRRLLLVSPDANVEEVVEKLGLNSDQQIQIILKNAKDFVESDMKIDNLAKMSGYEGE